MNRSLPLSAPFCLVPCSLLILPLPPKNTYVKKSFPANLPWFSLLLVLAALQWLCSVKTLKGRLIYYPLSSMAIILASRLPKIPLRAAIAHLFRLYRYIFSNRNTFWYNWYKLGLSLHLFNSFWEVAFEVVCKCVHLSGPPEKSDGEEG